MKKIQELTSVKLSEKYDRELLSILSADLKAVKTKVQKLKTSDGGSLLVA